MQALGAILQRDEESLHRALQELARAIGAMTEALRRMHGESSWCCMLQLISQRWHCPAPLISLPSS